MVHVPWQDQYNIHYKEVDPQHQVLLDILNELLDLVGQRVEAVQVTQLFSRLCQYAIKHFSEEEKFLEASGYERLDKQRAEHSWFIDKLLDLDRSYDPTDPLLLERALTFLKDWFVGHITHSDKEYADWVKDFYQRAEIRGVIFDFGGVLASANHDMFLDRLGTLCNISPVALNQRFQEEAWLFNGFDTGAVTPGQFLEEISQICGRGLTEDEFIPIFTGIFAPILSTCELVKQLKPRYRLGIMANTNPWHFRNGIRTSKVFPLFDAVAMSFKAMAAKPDRRIFQDALDQLGLQAEECACIDSSAAYAQAATGLLLHGIHYRGYSALQRDLARLNIVY